MKGKGDKMKKLVSLILCLAMILAWLPAGSPFAAAEDSSPFAGGIGTEEDPYLVSTVGDLKIMSGYPNSCYEMTFFNRKSQRTFTCQIVQNAKRHLKGAKTMQISGIGHSVIRGLGTTGQWFSASTTVYPRGSPQGRRHSYFVDC